MRLEGEPVAPGRLADLLRLVWLTPQQDRLFVDGAADRRRFFDRLVFAALPSHATRAGAYERAMRERMRLLTEGPADPAWLAALEARMAEAGAAMAMARAETLAALQAEIDQRGERPFPQAGLALTGDWERLAAEGADAADLAGRLSHALAASRQRDAGAGRTLTGPHRGDLAVIHAAKGPGGGGMFDRRAKGLDPEPGFGPGDATFACEIRARSYSVARRRSPPIWTRSAGRRSLTRSRRLAFRLF